MESPDIFVHQPASEPCPGFGSRALRVLTVGFAPGARHTARRGDTAPSSTAAWSAFGVGAGTPAGLRRHPGDQRRAFPAEPGLGGAEQDNDVLDALASYLDDVRLAALTTGDRESR